MLNLAALFKAFETIVAVRDAAVRLKGSAPAADEHVARTSVPAALANQLESRLTNVVVAALKEAFDRDHARLELERAQLDEQRRRSEEAMRMEARRQAADRDVGRFRLLAGTALIGWVAAVALLVARLDVASVASRGILTVGWLLLLASLGSAFAAQGRIGARAVDGDPPGTPSGAAALWLLITGLAVSAISVLF